VSPVLRGRLVEILLNLRERGVTLIIIEHVLEVIEQLCDQVSVMVAGSVIAEGSMAEMRSNKQVVNAYLS
jgi:ABC-type branched-subunit amino acid transport system ATPase component